ncbi:hypothetical protein RJT34_16448 [Clitoria ternatea]|uniref:Uncharacterized protein n=1 Tax=Clitoria ternatea TaxID=43366 RepID=A0AAN9J755_CLITE
MDREKGWLDATSVVNVSANLSFFRLPVLVGRKDSHATIQMWMMISFLNIEIDNLVLGVRVNVLILAVNA